MLLSMTGHGEGYQQGDGLAVTVEVRTINSRYFKCTLRTGDGFAAWEPRVDAAVRRLIRRGTIQVHVRIDRDPSPDDFHLNAAVLDGYRQQLKQLFPKKGVQLSDLLILPGVVSEAASRRADTEAEWAVVAAALDDALAHLDRMRRDEGQAMADDLRANCRQIAEQLDEVERRAPLTVDAYRQRLTERLNKLLAEYDVTVSATDVIREVGIFAERSDIAEETVRLRSHLEQFASIMAADESNGRKLEFLTQEMFRETNTIGSKANDAEIARHVIEIKACIERMREMIQNIE